MTHDAIFWLRCAQSCATVVAAATKDLELVAYRATSEMLLCGIVTESIYPARVGEIFSENTSQAENIVCKRSGLPQIVRAPQNGAGVTEPALSRLIQDTAKGLQRRFGEMLDMSVRGLSDYSLTPSVIELCMQIARNVTTARSVTKAEVCGIMQRGLEIIRGNLDATHVKEMIVCNDHCIKFDRLAEGGFLAAEPLDSSETLFLTLTRKSIIGELLGINSVFCDMMLRIARFAKRLK